MEDFQDLRNRMVEQQIVKRGITDSLLVEAMRHVPRHKFVPQSLEFKAYEDCPLPIGEGQTISQPYMVALMTQVLKLTKDDIVLEIGTGSGYQTAILAELSRKVYSIERVKELGLQAQETLRKLSYTNIAIHFGDGTVGLEEIHDKFNAIIVTAAAPGFLDNLLQQLTQDGRMVVPVGDQKQQVLMLFSKKDGQVIKEEFCRCVFVPLVGQFGWQNS